MASSSKSTAPMVDDSKKPINANTDWPAQQPMDMESSNNDQQLGVMPTNFDFNSMSAIQEHGAMPNYSMFEGGSGYGHSAGDNNNNMIGDDMAQENHFSGSFQEALDAKTPGYPDFDYQSSDMFNSSSAQIGHDFQPSLGAHTPFDPALNTWEAKTPYVAPMPHTSPHLSASEDHIPDLSLDASRSEAQPSNALFFGPQPSVDLSSDPQSSANYFPPTSPMETTFPESGPPTPTIKPTPPKKTSTPRKAKTKAMAVIAGDEGSEDEARSIPTSRAKGKGKAKATTAGDAQDERDDDAEMPTAGSSNKGKGRKGAAANKSSTNTPTSKPRAGAATKRSTTKQATTDPLSTMGHQRVRQAPKNGIAQTKPIPHSFEECDEADQTLINMRDNGHTWADCKARYAELEGITYGASTIPNRYERLKTAFVSMREEDNLRLFDFKKALEDDFNKKKWALIAIEIEKDGGDTYDPEDLRRRFKQLMEKTGFDVHGGLARQDADFKVDGADEENEDIDVAGDGEYAEMDIDDEEDDGGDSLAY